MARAATTSDAFNAVAEPRRRQILLLLADREYSVNEIVDSLRVDQPSVSKHLRVLRDTGPGADALQWAPEALPDQCGRYSTTARVGQRSSSATGRTS